MGRLFAVITAFMVLLWAGRAPADVVKVGLLADFTGAFATWGPQFQEGVEAYQALHGKIVKGPDDTPHEIQFIYRDTASQGPDKARQLAQELVLHDHVKFLCGLDLSPQSLDPARPLAVLDNKEGLAPKRSSTVGYARGPSVAR